MSALKWYIVTLHPTPSIVLAGAGLGLLLIAKMLSLKASTSDPWAEVPPGLPYGIVKLYIVAVTLMVVGVLSAIVVEVLI